MKITVVTDAGKLRERMQEFRRITGKEIGESLKAHARLACVNLAYRTQPFGDSAGAEAKGLGAVSRDIDKVYYGAKSEQLLDQTTSIAIRWYEAQAANNLESEHRALLEKRYSDVRPRKDKSELIRGFKARFQNYQNSGNIVAIGKIVRDMKFKGVLFDEFDSSFHKKSRDPKTGRVSGNVQRTLVLGAEYEKEQYRTRVMDRVGLTKAGWAKCAEAIPISGRVTVNTRGIPQWVTRNMGRASGHIKDNSKDPQNPSVTMTNATPWASNVIPPKEAQRALDDAAKNYFTYMTTYIFKTLQKVYELKSAA